MASKASKFYRPLARRAFTLVEMLVVIVIIVIGLIVLVPFIQTHRENSRRTGCLNRSKQIGLSIQNYASAYNNAFPPSAETYQKSSTGSTVGGYSFLVKLLPEMQYDYLFLKSGSCKSRLVTITDGDIDRAASGNRDLAEVMNTLLPEFVCPSNSNKLYKDTGTNPPQFAFTNYKACGASTRDSLLMASNPTGKPPYGTATIHPDGAIFPSDKNIPGSAMADGTSHTIFIMETCDDTNSRWMVGAECTLVGLPQASSPTGDKPLEPYRYFTPPDFSAEGNPNDESLTFHSKCRTFLTYDFRPRGADAGKYEDPGWARAPPAYGPSSMHPDVVIAGMGDGSTQALSKQTNAALFYFLITKAGNEPFY